MRVFAGAGILLLALTSCRTLPPGHPVRGTAPRAPAVTFAFYPESTLPGAATVQLPESGVEVRVAETPALRAEDILGIEVVPAELGKCLLFQITPKAADNLARVTPEHGRVVLIVNGAAYAARRVDESFGDGGVELFPEVPEAGLTHFAAELRRGLAVAGRAAPAAAP